MKEMIELPEIEATGKITPIVLMMKCLHIDKWEDLEVVDLELLDSHKNAAIAQYTGNDSYFQLKITNKARFGKFNVGDVIEITLR